MTNREIENLLQEQRLCRIAFKGDTHPYMAPFQYVVVDGALYFHFTDYGKKMQLLQKDSRVCVEIEAYKPDLSEYKFVVLRGTLEGVSASQERAKAIRKIAEDGQQELSTRFLAAHGFAQEAGWSSLTPDRPVVIVKLTRVTETVGLKSPE
jgi:nitroimidazol reductase NimA-like FMN-containing flavoprotein (pyridoxamine 5'-phosphate oxidase superfamily)